MNYNILSYLIGEGFKSVFRNKKSTFAALIIMFATMITVGIGIAGAKNITSMIKQLEKEVPVTVYINDGLSADEQNEVKDFIISIDGVEDVKTVTKAEALQEAKDKMAENADLLAQYSENNHPFPASYTVILKDINKSQDVINAINSIDDIKSKIKEIKSPETVISGLNKIDRGIKILFFGIGALLIAVSIVIIGNTIKLAVHARRREISIMKYVGATNNFIRAPFVVEGIVIGVVSTAISIITLGILYQIIFNKFNSMLVANIKIGMLQFGDIFQTAIGAFLILGVGIGVLGSVLSMKKYLKV